MSLASTDSPADFNRETPAHLRRPDEDRVLQEPCHRGTRPAPQNGALVVVSQFDRVSDWIGEIKEAWSRGGTQTMELARVVMNARKRLQYGEWSKLWANGQMPFSKRKGEMLVVIGERMGWIDAQTFAHLPTGWSVLYWLARLKREFFEKLLEEGAIHPKLTLQEAKVLVARSRGCRDNSTSRPTTVKRRLHQFRDFVQRTLTNWQSAERDLAERELTQLLELIRGGGSDGFERDSGIDRTSPRPGPRIFTTNRTATLHSTQQSVTTL